MKKCQIKVIVLTSVLSLVSTAGLAASPADGDNLYVYTKGSDKAIVYSLDNIKKITFGDSSMNLWLAKGNLPNKQFSYYNIVLLAFREGVHPTGLDHPLIGNEGVKITYDSSSQTVRIESISALSGAVVCDLQGRIVLRDKSPSTFYQLSLMGLPRGIYIIKTQGVNNASKKIIK